MAYKKGGVGKVERVPEGIGRYKVCVYKSLKGKKVYGVKG